MATLRLSKRAEADLLAIGIYTLRQWGEKQALAYLDELEAACRRLAENPDSGRACDDIRRRLRGFECGRHVVFYRRKTGGMLVSRILHERMLPERRSL